MSMTSSRPLFLFSLTQTWCPCRRSQLQLFYCLNFIISLSLALHLYTNWFLTLSIKLIGRKLKRDGSISARIDSRGKLTLSWRDAILLLLLLRSSCLVRTEWPKDSGHDRYTRIGDMRLISFQHWVRLPMRTGEWKLTGLKGRVLGYPIHHWRGFVILEEMTWDNEDEVTTGVVDEYTRRRCCCCSHRAAAKSLLDPAFLFCFPSFFSYLFIFFNISLLLSWAWFLPPDVH